MSDYMKAAKILAYLISKGNYAIKLEVEDILAKTTPAELDFYYYWICEAR